jgi:hypothetical protein
MKIEFVNGSVIEAIRSDFENKRNVKKRIFNLSDDFCKRNIICKTLILFKDENNLQICFDKLRKNVDLIKRGLYSANRFEVEFLDNIIIYGIVYNGSISKACMVDNVYVDNEIKLNEDDYAILHPLILNIEPQKQIISF